MEILAENLQKGDVISVKRDKITISSKPKLKKLVVIVQGVSANGEKYNNTFARNWKLSVIKAEQLESWVESNSKAASNPDNLKGDKNVLKQAPAKLEKCKEVFQSIIDHLHTAGNEPSPVTVNQTLTYIYKQAEKAIKDIEEC